MKLPLRSHNQGLVRVRIQMQRVQRRLGLEDRFGFDAFLDLSLGDVRVLTRRRP